jgi:hypothetical protein
MNETYTLYFFYVLLIVMTKILIIITFLESLSINVIAILNLLKQ